ncbi:store-operated calcium entry regulator STIMATE-like [Pollicipes pollicipes]|uniref:store-operated calcium entry regulator STIMATE-like n=1 Tax=Pollicipes pollicipes TaxID=41117 RepID=UPI0018851169|nr:store-operated calcium entry regulator STIMATE-like [Pollicipes pollicipes]XP_037092113.1 store-operated calcium entry regulator STIMATE-like [Pollicipes pollicipes]XP_037092114.1 store-operated calcium entry regulator STIMATE-like [Pollicipes pollicipes]XP_037092115.1 store-operated calcium entry regulator STIMATE-like [Pollicipes pollicipes]XP_037092116.1 store-operated calcium entry regulator STIMATE-like [Pollicipes pollicipes]XP_037092117.1 store-operated calcium entry regulator STIMAT
MPFEMAIAGNVTSHCAQNALTDGFGWFIQFLLAGLAFASLIIKRFCEPEHERRSWLIWFYDTSKQGVGAMVVHFANVYLATTYTGDPCTWYIINFLLDSTVGLVIIFICVRICQHLAVQKDWPSINFGEYGNPPVAQSWLVQSVVYVFIMILEKLVVSALIQLDIWDRVSQIILSPITNPRLELAIVVLVIPFFVNALMFWITDNFLMRRRPGLARSPARGRYCPYQDKLDDDEQVLLMENGHENLQQRHPSGGATVT